MKKGNRIHIGTSGWHYEHWKGPFYPEDLPDSSLLKYYADRFSTVEINNSFYQIPHEKTLREWKETVPAGFIFAVKGSRYITHMKKLKDAEKPLNTFLEKIDMIGDKLGPVLFQLPPRWNVNTGRLDSFLTLLPKKYRYTFEFRDPSWFDRKVYALLEEHGAAFCIYDLDGRQSPKMVTTDLVYIRLHGPDGPYRGQYSVRQLAGWAGAISTWVTQGKTVYCYFDNDEAGYAAVDARNLQDMTEGL
ncbi:MAG: DUF72 domain-containing protein [Candidatus Sulfobium sp.]|jgi:uncharacterized protein YecE (DUF72 family)